MRVLRNRSKSRRGSYFFVLDAFIAAILITSTLVLITGRHTATPSSVTATNAAQDVLLYLDQTSIGQLDNIETRSLIAQGVINETDKSLLYHLAWFNVTGNVTRVQILGAAATRGVPPQLGYDLRVGGVSAVNRSIATQDAAPVYVVLKRIVIVRTSPSAVAQPVIIEVRTWQ